MTREIAWDIGVELQEVTGVWYVTLNGVKLGEPFGRKEDCIKTASWVANGAGSFADAINTEMEKE